jgi:ribonucleoside-diphosphate reductase alpha subunit
MLDTKNFVIKRDGTKQRVLFDKIHSRIATLCYNLDMDFIDPVKLSMRTFGGLVPGVTTAALDVLSSEYAASLTSEHPDYGVLASRISISNFEKNTEKSFSKLFAKLANCYTETQQRCTPLVHAEAAAFVAKHADALNAMIVHSRNANYDFFGFQTLCRSYLRKLDGVIAERPQHMLMRIAVGLHLGDLSSIHETYDLLSRGYYTHASPTMFNSCALKPFLASCYLLMTADDSIEGIYDTMKQCAVLSKSAGGQGIAVHNIRAAGSYIAGTNGVSNGLVPMLRVFNNTALYVDQGGGKRKGAVAIYLEPWHADILQFLDLKRNNGMEQNRARDLFYGLWIPDLFMKRVNDDAMWSLMCPKTCPGLDECHSAAFEELYTNYESKAMFVRQIKARQVWDAILTSQIEVGMPYMLYKDACNRKSNQQNLGTIRCSNLCCEIIQYVSPAEIAVCNLASIALQMFVKNRVFDYDLLYQVTRTVCRNLNRVIDVNHYELPECETSNLENRPMAIGVQAFADCLLLLRLPFSSPEAAEVNVRIFETMYFAACTESMELAKVHGTYESYEESPMSRGQFQFDLWNVTPQFEKWDWNQLRRDVKAHGMRNSLLIALMPTASTSQILGNNECFEPYTSNLYVRRTLAGEHILVNKHLVKDLIALKLWNVELKNEIIRDNGSVQQIKCIPLHLKELYRTVWEIPSKVILDLAIARAPFIDHSQSLNIHMRDVTKNKLTSMHFYGWKHGLKTGMYYLRTERDATATPFTLEVETNTQQTMPTHERVGNDTCSRDDPTCISCGS